MVRIAMAIEGVAFCVLGLVLITADINPVLGVMFSLFGALQSGTCTIMWKRVKR